MGTISPAPPSGYSYHGISFYVIDINGNYRQVSANNTQPGTGTFSFSWTPDIRGTYFCIFTYPGETLAGNVYTRCQRNDSFFVDISLPTVAPTPITDVQTNEAPVVLWHKTYVSNGAYDAIQTSDGGYAVVSPGDGGCKLVKFDSSGIVEWNNNYSNTLYGVYPKSIVQTADGGYAVAGFAQSADGVVGHVWLFKTDSTGTLLWSTILGDDQGVQSARCLIQTSDGGFAITGDYGGYNGYEGPNGWNFLFMKTDSEGNLQWTKVIGKRDDDRATAIIQTLDGGYALTGCTSNPGNSPMFWLVKTDSSGDMQWNQSYPETLGGWSYSITQTKDGGYALVGTGGGSSSGSIWLIKTDSAGNKQWTQSIGKTMGEANCVIQSSDGGYVVAGGREYQLVKTDANGNLQWIYCDGDGGNIASEVIQTQDGAYFLAGQNSGWLTKLSDGSPALEATPVPQVTENPNPVNYNLNADQQSVIRSLPIYIIFLVVIADLAAFTAIMLLYSQKRKRKKNTA